MAAPVWGALEESGFLGWIVIPVGLAPTFGDTRVALDPFLVEVELDPVSGDSSVQTLADVAIGHGVEGAGDLGVAIEMHDRLFPTRQLEGHRGQREQRGSLDGLED